MLAVNDVVRSVETGDIHVIREIDKYYNEYGPSPRVRLGDLSWWPASHFVKVGVVAFDPVPPTPVVVGSLVNSIKDTWAHNRTVIGLSGGKAWCKALGPTAYVEAGFICDVDKLKVVSDGKCY